MNTPINIGLIGCGRAAELLYLPALAHLAAEARLVAVADPLDIRRELIASGIPGCRAFASVEELLDEAKIAAAIITTPPETHVTTAIQALSAGIPVLVEKPLAPSLAGIKELEALLASSNNFLMMGFNRRYWEPICQLRQRLSRQPKSDIASVQLVMTTNVQAWSPISATSDPLDDLGVHQLDLLRYIFGSEILAISARWTDPQTIQMRVRLADNLVADCLVAHTKGYQEFITIKGNHQSYQIRMDSERIQPSSGWIRSLLDRYDTIKRRLQRQTLSLPRSYERQLTAFFDYIRTGVAPQPDITDGIAIIQATQAARQSIANNGVEVLI